ncbi:hypothetical protein GCM10010505_51820 [Kitasatospora aburaviensis]
MREVASTGPAWKALGSKAARAPIPGASEHPAGGGKHVTVDRRRAAVTSVPAPVTPALTVRRYIDQALICSACCR